jgi:hypothetical protein
MRISRIFFSLKYNSHCRLAHLLDDYGDNNTNRVRLTYERELDFLNRVDLTKGPILVKVESMVRTMSVDWESPKRERKEYMYYTCEWEAKDWLGNTIRSNTHTEGKYTQQTKEIKITLNQKTGEHLQQYHRGHTREAYTIPWNKKMADSILTGEKYFGEDSINITNLAENSRYFLLHILDKDL